MSPKQKKILAHLARVTEHPTIDELMVLFGAGATKQAMQSTLRYLEEDGLLERRYETRTGSRRLVLRLTPRGEGIGVHLPL
jgi:DNA-binding MarR family transcriptional regulator